MQFANWSFGGSVH